MISQPRTTPSQIAICHSARLFGECLERVLADRESLVGRWLSPEFALSIYRSPRASDFRLLLLDASLPSEQASLLIVLVRTHFPHCKVLLLVPDALVAQLASLVCWGADAFVRESGTLDELCTAIRMVLDGQTYFPPELAGALFLQLRASPTQLSGAKYVGVPLTAREEEVLQLIALEDLANKQIARRLQVSLHTVKNHVHSLIEKLGGSSRHDAARLARQRSIPGIPSVDAS
jgi:DNA-binding NarL/FixJ family response regulator